MMQRNHGIARSRKRWPPALPGRTSRIDVVRAEQATRGGESCFMTQKRLLCGHDECEWRDECRRLVAVWKR